jgi:hypothetical protein
VITEQQVQWAMDILIDRDSQAAKARAAHEHMSDMDKVVLAQLTSRPRRILKPPGRARAGHGCTLITGRIWTRSDCWPKWTIKRATGDPLRAQSLRHGAQNAATRERGQR